MPAEPFAARARVLRDGLDPELWNDLTDAVPGLGRSRGEQVDGRPGA